MGLETICALYSFDPPNFGGPTFDLLPSTGCDILDPYAQPGKKQKQHSLPGSAFDLPSPYVPGSDYGLNGPGEARTIYPGLVERKRPMHYDEKFGFHENTELHSVLLPEFTTPVKNTHTPLAELCPWLKDKE